MNIFDYAMQLEKESQNYYLSLASKTGDGGLGTIFTMLAVEEARHYEVLKAMKTNTNVEFGNTALLSDAKAVFVKMADTERFNFSFEQLDVYKKAKEIESKSRKFYLEKAEEVEDSSQKAIFAKLAKEEEKHFFLLENIIDFVSQPETWLENAEWYHLEEY